jgi:uncharacterized RDD family membrane protein YckC
VDEGDDWGDTLAGFDIGDLSPAQRATLSDDLAAAGVLHAYVGPELQGPAAESELIEHLIGQTRRGDRGVGGDRGVDPAGSASGAFGGLPRALRLPWGMVPIEALDHDISPRWRRFVAYLLESLAFGFLTWMVFRYSVGGAELFAAASVVLSNVVLVAGFGGTAGMLALRMRIVSLADPDRTVLGWRLALVRFVVASWPDVLRMALVPFVAVESLTWLAALAQIWLVVCFGPILLDPARRGLHDRVAGTIVVDLPRRRRSAHPSSR